jgi:hypothetical protein
MDRWLRYANKPNADDLVRATAKRRTEDFFARTGSKASKAN